MKRYLLIAVALSGFGQTQGMQTGAGPEGSKTTKHHHHRRSRSLGSPQGSVVFEQPRENKPTTSNAGRSGCSEHNQGAGCARCAQSCCLAFTMLAPLLIQLGFL